MITFWITAALSQAAWIGTKRVPFDNFVDEYRPFDAGLNALDQISSVDLFRRDVANLNWGMEAAMRSANRGAEAIHKL